jgi:hypothetical protein
MCGRMNTNEIQLQVEIRRISSRLNKLESNEKEVVGALEALTSTSYGMTYGSLIYS